MAHNPPEGYTRITPYLLYEDASAAIDFLTSAFGFTERMRMAGEGGQGVAHAELDYDGSPVMLGTPGGEFAGPASTGVDSPAFVHVYVDDIDAHHARAKEGAGPAPGSSKRFACLVVAAGTGRRRSMHGSRKA